MDLLRRFQLALRRSVPWSPVVPKRLGTWRLLRDRLSENGTTRLTELSQKYEIDTWTSSCSVIEMHESLYILDLCDQWLGERALIQGEALDVGSKNGAYLPALSCFYGGRWTGVELDAHRRYLTMETRAGHARRILTAFPNVTFQSGSVLEVTGTFDLITWFLPFLTEGPLDAWGLPKSEFKPEELLDHVVSKLSSKGLLLTVHQNETEEALQRELFKRYSGRVTPMGELASSVSPFKNRRRGLLYVAG